MSTVVEWRNTNLNLMIVSNVLEFLLSCLNRIFQFWDNRYFTCCVWYQNIYTCMYIYLEL